jgi:hypothetical protein
MFRFKEYLNEAKKEKQKSFNLNDAKGKLFEILVGSHLHAGTHKSGAPNEMLQHFRDENNKTPTDIHNNIKNELDVRHPGMYDQIANHASIAAKHIRDQLAAQGHHTIHHGAWTSQPSDHKNFTGKEDPNSDADVMLNTNKGPVGISLKYGSMSTPNLRNNGFETLSKMSGADESDLNSHRQRHAKRLKELGIDSHDTFKRFRDSEDPAERQAAAEAEKSAGDVQRNVAGALSNSLLTKNTNQLKDYVNNIVAPKTQFQHFRYHGQVGKNGTDLSHHMDDVQNARRAMDDYEELRTVPHNGSISVKIEGRRKGESDFSPVLNQGIKKGSGPTKGFASTTQAPYLTRKPKPIKPVVQVQKPVKSIKPSGEHGGIKFNSSEGM